MIKKRNYDLYKIKNLEKELAEKKNTLRVMEMRVKDCGDYMIQLQDVEKRIASMVDKTDVEEMQTQILAHMLKRDKKILLYQREPLPRKMKKLEYTLE